MRKLWTRVIVAGCILVAWEGVSPGGFRTIVVNDSDGGGGLYINLIMREVTVSPLRARVGDTIRVDMVIEDQSDVRSAKGDLEIRANGKVVARKRVGDDIFGGQGERMYRHSLLWDTKGAQPGEYRIRAEFFVWEDASEFDNFLNVREPVVLLAPGESFAAGEPGGGTAIERDPRYRPRGPAR